MSSAATPEQGARAPLAPWLRRQLEALLAQRGHAWLLQGPSGLGQFELGLAMVRAWLCDQPTSQGACGHCASCHGIDVHTHSDLTVLMPETEMLARGWPLPEKAQADIDDKKRKPSKDIRVDAMRETIEFAQRTSGRGRGKAVLIYPAERMNAVTANALLKTLEEPPGDVRFVLATDAAELLLPTIRSRCLTHTLDWPNRTDALGRLDAHGVAAEEGQALLRAAGGRPDDALALAEAKLTHRQWAMLPKAMAGGNVSAMAGLPLPEVVARLQKLCHDAMAMQVGAPPRYFESGDLPHRPLSMSALTRWWTQLSQAARTAEHSLNAGLATEFLVGSAKQALNSKG